MREFAINELRQSSVPSILRTVKKQFDFIRLFFSSLKIKNISSRYVFSYRGGDSLTYPREVFRPFLTFIFVLSLMFFTAFSYSIAFAVDWQNVGTGTVSSGTASNTSLQVVSNNEMYLAYQHNASAPQKTMVFKWNGSSWSDFGSSFISGTTQLYQSLHYVTNNQLYVAYRDDGNSGKATVMKATAGGVWSTVGTAGFSAGQANYVSLKAVTGNEIYVAYQDIANSNKATVMKWDGSTWSAVGGAGFSAGNLIYTRLDVINSSEIYVGYMDVANSNKATVMKWNGSTWSAVGSAGFSSTIASTANGTLQAFAMHALSSNEIYVAYSDNANLARVTVMKWNGSTWSTVGTGGFSAGVATQISIKALNNGEIYVAFNDTTVGKETVMKWNGSTWSNVGTAGFTAGGVLDTSLQVLSASEIYAAQRDAGNSGKATVMKFFDSPVIVAVNPTPNAVNVPSNNSVTITVTDNLGVSLNSASMTINNILVFKDGVAQNNYSITTSNITQGYQIIASTSNFYSSAAFITVNVQVLNTNNLLTSYNYQFRIQDTSGPVVLAVSPTSNATNIAPTRGVTINVTDDVGVSANSIRVTINGVLALANGVTQNGYLGTLATTTNGYQMYLVTGSHFVFNSIVTVDVSAQDINNNSSASTYYFTILNDTTPLTITPTFPLENATDAVAYGTIVQLSFVDNYFVSLNSIRITADNVLAFSDGTTQNGYDLVGLSGNGAPSYGIQLFRANNYPYDYSKIITVNVSALDENNNLSQYDYHFTTIPDPTAPLVHESSPYNGQTNVPLDTAITLSITDDGHVVTNSIVITINGVLAFANGQAQNGYTVTTANTTYTYPGYEYVFTTANVFALNHVVTVDVSAADTGANTTNYTYTFQTTAISSTIYLSPTGDDTAGDGTVGNPYQTVSKGFAMVSSGGTIYFYPGTFTMNARVNISNSVTLIAYAAGGANSQNVIISGGNASGLFTMLGSSISVTFNNLTLTNASDTNGAVFSYSNGTNDLNLIDVIVSGNRASSNGAVFNVSSFSGVTINITNSIFNNNVATSNGGVFYGNGYKNIINSQFTNNSAANGGVFFNNFNINQIDVTNSYFGNNIASSSGGISYGYGNFYVTASTIVNNRANSGDGGVGLTGGYSMSWQLINCIVTGNFATQYGGVGAAGTWTVANSIFSQNRALNGGVGSWGGYSATWTVTNSVFTNNNATQNGGVFEQVTGYVNTSTFVSNNAVTQGGVGRSGTMTIRNSIFWGNTSATGKNFNTTTGTISYSLIENLNIGSMTNGGNLINSNPLFVSSSNFHLTDFSPAVDVGTNTNLPAYDLDGSPRVYGLGVDMGAYENQTHTFVISDFSPAINATAVVTSNSVAVRIRSISATLNISSVSLNINNILYTQSGPNTFNFSDNGSPTTGDVTFTVQPAAPFSYSTLIGVTINGLDSLGNSLNNYAYSFTTDSAPFIHNLNSLQNYGDFNTAITNATTGDVLFVDAGNHLISATITVNKSLTISANAGTTTLNGQSLYKIMHVSGVSVSILGLDFVSGNSNTSGGLHLIAGSLITLNRVTFVGNNSSGGIAAGGGAIGVLSGATLNARYVTLIANTNPAALGGAVFNNGYLVMEDCQVVSNSAGIGGGIAHYLSKGGIFNRIIVSRNIGTNATFGGAGFITVFSSSVTIANSVFAGNYVTSGTAGTALLAYSGAINVYQSTFVNNPLGVIGNGTPIGGGANGPFGNFVNNIFYNNGSAPFLAGSTVNMTYSYAEDFLLAVSGNLRQTDVGTPNFVGGGSYQLSAASPLKDVATSNIPVVYQTDLTGYDRNLSALFDMGAYEYHASSDTTAPVLYSFVPGVSSMNVVPANKILFKIDEADLNLNSLRVTVNGVSVSSQFVIGAIDSDSYQVTVNLQKYMLFNTTYNVTASVVDNSSNSTTYHWLFMTGTIIAPTDNTSSYDSGYRDVSGNPVDINNIDPNQAYTYEINKQVGGLNTKLTLDNDTLIAMSAYAGNDLSTIEVTADATTGLPMIKVPSNSALAVYVNNNPGVAVTMQMVVTNSATKYLAVDLENGEGFIRLMNYDRSLRTDLATSYNSRVVSFNQTGPTINFVVSKFSDYGVAILDSVNFVTPNLSVTAGATVTLTVRVLDNNSDGVSSAPVIFTIVSGPSIITQNVATNSVVVTSDVNGYASVLIAVSSNATVTTISASVDAITSNPLAVVSRTFNYVAFNLSHAPITPSYESIPEAILAASANDVIVVTAGAHILTDHITINKSLTLRGYTEVGATSANVILKTDGNNRHFYFDTASVTVTMSYLTLQDGKPSANGGSIYVAVNTVTLNFDSIIATGNQTSGNANTFDGGFLYSATSTNYFRVINSRLVNNRASRSGGITVSGNWYVENSYIGSNQSTNDGGVAIQGSWIVSASTIELNSGLNGGVVKNTSMTLFNSVVSKNSASATGGFGSTATTTINNSIFYGNSAATGGGVAFGLSTIRAVDSTFNANISTGTSTGGVAGTLTTWLVTGSYFVTNSANQGGIGNPTSFTAYNSIFINNSAVTGAVGTSGTWTIRSSKFIGNAASASGGLGAGTWTILNSIVSGNTAVNGGVAYTGTFTIQGSTLYGNNATNGSVAGKVSGIASANLQIKNSILYNNPGTDLVGITGNIAYSLVQGLTYGGATNGGNNFDSDPLFYNSLIGDLRLTYLSPALNVGTSNVTSLVDYLGSARGVYGGFDVGAYEYTSFYITANNPSRNTTNVLTSEIFKFRVQESNYPSSNLGITVNINGLQFYGTSLNRINNGAISTTDITVSINLALVSGTTYNVTVNFASPGDSLSDVYYFTTMMVSENPILLLQSFQIDSNGIRAPSANGYTGNETDLVPGSQIIYKIQIVNTGNATANAIKIYQTIPTHTTFYNIPSNSQVTENSGTVNTVPDVDYFDGQGVAPTNTWIGGLSGTPSANITRIRFNVFDLAPSASATVRYSVTVD